MSQGMWPQSGYGQPPPRPSTVRSPATLPPPVAFEQVGGTPFGVAIVGVAPRGSGPATASLVTGVASILVSLVVACFAAIGAQPGWGPLVAGAFAVLSTLAGVAAFALGRTALRQIRTAVGWSVITGRGLAIAGMICGGVGLLFTVVSIAAALAVVAGQS